MAKRQFAGLTTGMLGHWMRALRQEACGMEQLAPKGHMGHTIRFDSPEALAVFREDVQSRQFMERKFGAHTRMCSYDVAEFDWQGMLRTLLVEKGIARAEDLARLHSLSDLHTILTPEWTELDESELNKTSQSFYDNDAEFDALYRRFIRDVVARDIGGPVWWQTTPTIRFHFPKQGGFNWKPRYHTDIMLGHPPQEVNVWIPLTNVYGANAMCLAPFEESYAILRDVDFDFEKLATLVQYDEAFGARCGAAAKSLQLAYGEYVMFDPRCLHATQDNDTAHTRISIDLRVLPQGAEREMRIEYRGTGRRRMLFAPGHYYDATLSSDI
jgi:hypothetical protein